MCRPKAVTVAASTVDVQNAARKEEELKGGKGRAM
jgi:hypothetical protein